MANNKKAMVFLDTFMKNDDNMLESAYEAFGFKGDEYDEKKELEAYNEYKKNLEY